MAERMGRLRSLGEGPWVARERSFFTLGEAARQAGKSKATISHAIKSGKLSVQGKQGGRYMIAASELFRVYPPERPNGSMDRSGEQSRTPQPNVLEHELTLLREERERERQQLQATIDDLRHRLDVADDQRRRLTAMITDDRPRRRSWWRFWR
jgi:hypothetical protein